MKGFSSKRIALKLDGTGAKIYCLQARSCIFQPGNFTGCGSEGVNYSTPTDHAFSVYFHVKPVLNWANVSSRT